MTLRTPPIRSWKNPKSLGSLLIFVQALEEKLFDFTIDAYKARALNLHTIAYEIRLLGEQVRLERIQSGALIPVIEEYRSLCKLDPVLTSTEKVHFQAYADRFEHLRNKPSQFNGAADALLHELDGYYWERLCREISSQVEKSGNSDQLIRLADAFISEAELEGFHRRFIFTRLKRIFWRSSISSPAAITKFLSRFSEDEKTYQIVLKVSRTFLSMKEYAPSIGLYIGDDAPEVQDPSARTARFIDERRPDETFAIGSDIKARDGVSARNIAELHIETLANLHSFHVHRQEPSWRPVALCLGDDDSFQALIKPPPLPMRRHPHDEIEGSVPKVQHLIEMIGGVHLLPRDSQLFFKAINYHRAALEANISENQLVNLWAALEGFLPPPDPNSARIHHYCAVLLPSLVLTYAESLFADLEVELNSCSPDTKKSIDDSSAFDTFFEKVVYLIVTKDQEKIRNKLYKSLDMHPLLRYRCYQLNECFRNNKRIKETLASYREKVEWHVQRIYTTRNQIMHNAESFPYRDTLVENLHYYVDTLLQAVVKVSVRGHRVSSIRGALQILSISETSLIRELDQEKVYCDSDNFRHMVFGRLNPLSRFNERLSI